MGEKKIEDILEELARKISPPRLDGFLSAEDAAHFLGGIPVGTLAEKTRNKEIPAYKVGRYVVYDPKDLREYVRRHKK